MKLVYSFFHLNLAYSSIEEEQRPEVIKRCYWPLLHLIEELQIPAGIEATVYTLESIAAIDNKWIEKLKELINQDLIELVGSGYAQIIGPIIPARVNESNLILGNKGYGKMLGIRPQIALVNEQAFSSGLVELYKNAGYEAIIMEWNNPAHIHPEWDQALQYYPQYAQGTNDCRLPVIWNNSVAFQKFQRYAHGDMELEEYLDYLSYYTTRNEGMFCLYGNDIEVFDFRPGRYQTEANLSAESEWLRIRRLFEMLKKNEQTRLVKPGEVLSLMDEDQAGNILSLQSAEQPIPVKKQAKYNITRWAVTGRDDLGINTDCWYIYENLVKAGCQNDEDWQELCYLWSSDFRTHITEKRWQDYRRRLECFKIKTARSIDNANNKGPQVELKQHSAANPALTSVTREGRYISISNHQIKVKLDCKRGLTLNGLWLQEPKGPFLCGTIPHGFYNDIAVDFDWYTGHTVIECLGKPKITDLNPVDPEIEYTGEDICINGTIQTAEGNIHKLVRVSSQEPMISWEYKFALGKMPAGSFRLGYITLNPLAFEQNSLFYRTCNGACKPETFLLGDTEFDHGSPVSFLVSANNCAGMTEGWIEVGDASQIIRVEVDKTVAALVGLVSYRKINNSFLLRLSFSAGEWDETRRLSDLILEDLTIKMKIKLMKYNNDTLA
ncbi:MAG: hypothetical protein PHF24_09890 [Syntrophomonas sp.]|nr:hypothetical protein [Syntrophomonas sp.]